MNVIGTENQRRGAKKRPVLLIYPQTFHFNFVKKDFVIVSNCKTSCVEVQSTAFSIHLQSGTIIIRKMVVSEITSAIVLSLFVLSVATMCMSVANIKTMTVLAKRTTAGTGGGGEGEAGKDTLKT